MTNTTTNKIEMYYPVGLKACDSGFGMYQGQNCGMPQKVKELYLDLSDAIDLSECEETDEIDGNIYDAPDMVFKSIDEDGNTIYVGINKYMINQDATDEDLI